ncbi:hypothetical protein JHK85_016293 [Glycine max]|nr:hypothetical protein JHK85_016293 [Glycine max]
MANTDDKVKLLIVTKSKVIDYQMRQSIILSYRSFLLLKLAWALDYQAWQLINSMVPTKFQVEDPLMIRCRCMHVYDRTEIQLYVDFNLGFVH